MLVVRTWLLLVAALLLASACNRGASSGPAAAGPAASATPAGRVPADVTLPSSPARASMPADALVVVLSRARLALGRDGPPLAVPDPDTWSAGFARRYKRESINDLFVVPFGAGLASRRGDAAALPRVAIAADASVPYRLLIETIYTLGQEGGPNVALLVRSGASVNAIELAQPRVSAPLADKGQFAALLALAGDASAPHPVAPRPGGSTAPPAALPPLEPSRGLDVVVTGTGFSVAAGPRLAPGCREAGAGPEPTVPKRDGAYDFAALGACAASVKAAPGFAAVTMVVVSATAGTNLQTVVSTMDALRGTGAPLFPQVALGVPR